MPKATQILMEGLLESKWQNLPRRMVTTEVSTVCTMQVLHPFFNASTKWSKSLVSASSWSHGSILWLQPSVRTLTSDVTKLLFLQDSRKTKFWGREIEKALICWLPHVKPLQFSGILFLLTTFILIALPRFSLLAALMLSLKAGLSTLHSQCAFNVH